MPNREGMAPLFLQLPPLVLLKVASYLKQSAEVLQQKTHESATNALGIMTDALSLICYSEKLLNMKGEALFVEPGVLPWRGFSLQDFAKQLFGNKYEYGK
ncbi:hypothetical protein L1987_35171 [Smallanthus sonchifolius]|uniref:Uncharacterized protein n=1 Tax=Smallanthus sonchifolius TaxID=185202 RepID=A0ACB9HWL5_9ASTR|nr:hypothetical protein L1987_35171 [Smallanthus sonchifolius]